MNGTHDGTAVQSDLLDDIHDNSCRATVQATRGLICQSRKCQWNVEVKCTLSSRDKENTLDDHKQASSTIDCGGERASSLRKLWSWATYASLVPHHLPRKRMLGLVTSSTPMVNRFRSPTDNPFWTVPTMVSATLVSSSKSMICSQQRPPPNKIR